MLDIDFFLQKYTNLKHNYKCLEEQHYKAQERIQFLLNENKNRLNLNEDEIITQCNQKPPVSLFPCENCHKNFVSSELLKSHQQRKHSAIEEKHELSDDNEKKDDHAAEINAQAIDELEQSLAPQLNPSKCIESNASSTNNNNNNESNTTNCTECSKKTKIHSSSIAIQCEVSSSTAEQIELAIEANTNIEKCKNDETNLDNDLVQSAYEVINELKKEIFDLKNSIEQKTAAEPHQPIPEPAVSIQDPNSVDTNDKIDVIEQKFNAFETMYVESQSQFIESFRNLDERQKIYMDNIQETIKEIVEKSLGQRDIHAIDNDMTIHENVCDTKTILRHNTEPENASIDKQSLERTINHLPENSADEILNALEKNVILKSSSGDDDDDDYGQEHSIIKADVHFSERSAARNSIEDEKNKSKKNGNKKMKEIAFNDFEQKLRQFGVDIESTGLSTPRSSEVKHDLAEEREEIKKVRYI